MNRGQIAQSVEQGTENPRVGGSNPSLATLFFLSLFGCQTDHCEDLCSQTSFALRDCLQEWPADWFDLDTTNRTTFQNACSTRWDRVQSDLEARELEDALQQCRESVVFLQELEEEDMVCDHLRAIYLP